MDEKQDTFNTGAMVSMMNLLANGSNAHGDEVALARSVLLSRIGLCKSNYEACKTMLAWKEMAIGIMKACEHIFPSRVEANDAAN